MSSSVVGCDSCHSVVDCGVSVDTQRVAVGTQPVDCD